MTWYDPDPRHLRPARHTGGRTVVPGEEAMAVPGTVHDFWNPGEEEAHVLLPCHPDPAVLALAGLAPPNPGTASYQAGADDR